MQSAGPVKQPQKRRDMFSVGDSQSTTKEGQSTTSERCEQIQFPEGRGRKGSDPVIKSVQAAHPY